MRYEIPTDKRTQEKDCIRLLRMVTGQQAQNLDQALRVILTLADRDHVYQESQGYEKLYSVYKLLGLTDKESAAELFPNGERNEDNLKEELNKLWCVLQLQPLEKDKDLKTTYQKWQSDPKKYKAQLEQADREEADRQKNQEPEQDQEPLPLVDKESPYYSFVSGTAYEDLFDLWNDVKNRLDYNQKTAEILKQDMEQLLSEVQLHYIRRNGSGSCLPMTDNEYKKLTHLYGECVKDVTRLKEKGGRLAEYDQLSYLLAQNNNQLKGVSLGKLPPLANVIHGFDTPTIDFQDTHSDSLSGAMSSREAVEYIDENGELHQGFFTAEFSETNAMDDMRGILKHYQNKYSDYDAHFVELFSKSENFKPFQRAAMEFKSKKKQNAMDRYIDMALWIPEEEKANENFRAILKELAVDVEKIRNRHAVLSTSGIKQGDEIAKRSSAMSDVARTLGFPNLLVNSRRVKVKREGREITGVMMDAAGPNTADPAYLVGTDPFYQVNPNEFNSKAMLGSLADLQILDYLCANTDRHANNFFFQQDFSDPENPKLLGVQGIDNDNSFGKLQSGGVMRLARPENLKIITTKMAAAIESMTSQDLEELLKPYRFSKEQVNTASVRLAQLQDMIKKGRENDKLDIKDGKLINQEGSIHIVKEDEWNQLTLKSLIPAPEDKGIDRATGKHIWEIPSNIFYMTSGHWSDVRKKGKTVGEENKDKTPIRYSKQGLEIDSEKLLELQNEEYQKLEDIKKRMDDNGAIALRDRSKKFQSMYRVFQEYMQEYQKMQQILTDTKNDKINPKPVKGKKDIPQTKEEKLAACYRNLEAAKQQLDHEIERYRNKSHVFKIKPDNQARIDAAVDLQKLIRGKRESEKFFENSIELQERHKANLNSNKKNDFQLAGYISNQIYGRMKVTLQSNLKALKANDPVHVNGIKALEAQERLWNYAQSSLEMGFVSVKKTNEEKQRVSVEQLQKEIKKKANDNIDMKQVYADMETIRGYAQELNRNGNENAAELINQIDEILNPKENEIEKKPKISGRTVKAVLNKMHQGELQIAKERQKENRINPEIQHQNRRI